MAGGGLARNVDWDAVAPYYDAYVRTAVDVPFFLDVARRAGGPVLELLCGTGRLTLPIAADGHEVVGVDSSPALLAVLRAKRDARHATASVVEADVRSFDLGRAFPLAFVGFHAFAEVLGRADRLRAMRAIRSHVAPGGRFVLTLHNPPARAASLHPEWRSMGTFPLGDAPSRSVEVSSRWELDRASARVRGEQRYREIGEGVRVLRELAVPIAFDLVAPDEVEDLARRSGFRVREVLGDYERSAFEASSPFAIFELVAE